MEYLRDYEYKNCCIIFHVDRGRISLWMRVATDIRWSCNNNINPVSEFGEFYLKYFDLMIKFHVHYKNIEGQK